MGLRNLDSLMALLVEHGRDPSTPACVIQSASLPTQRTVVGTVADIAEKVRAAGLGMPSLTIVGNVVGLREHLRWFDKKPLFGKRVLVTRPSGQAHVLSELLRDEGAEPVEAPTIEIADPSDGGPLARAVASLDSYRWVVFTSKNGVDRFFAALERARRDARALGNAKVAAIGPGTAAALAQNGVRPDHVPSEYRGEAVAEILLAAHDRDLSGVRVLLPRAEVAREALPDILRAHGAEVDVVPAYKNVPPTGADAERVRRLVVDREVDVVTFTASSTVSNLCDLVGDDAAAHLAHLAVASIGPITTETAERLGVRVDVTASEYTNAGLVHALADHFAARTERVAPEPTR
jgi:uroporphyrinogen III methyltransferase/synthase